MRPWPWPECRIESGAGCCFDKRGRQSDREWGESCAVDWKWIRDHLISHYTHTFTLINVCSRQLDGYIVGLPKVRDLVRWPELAPPKWALFTSATTENFIPQCHLVHSFANFRAKFIVFVLSEFIGGCSENGTFLGNCGRSSSVLCC